MSWTDERVEALKKLWAEGLSASQIAAQLGGVSRNAVIGKVHRLKLSGRGRTNAAPARQKKAAAPVTTTATAPAQAPAVRSKPRPAALAAPVRPMVATTVGATALKVQYDEEPAVYQQYQALPDNVVPIARNLKLIELTERTCKWPNGDPLSEDFSFCGADSTENSPYCTFHSRLAYQPAAERRRLR